ncbi:Conidiation-specific protein 6 [Tepidanaerobacter acetatoxydans Re1]|uniref:Conidiation-specific protein 6 n=1 Tax=Tepidanaerobacter acetatoxydans (strain DSM 21804 / JCM 16047 / Re1) TaxID=1209989 RepID=F4LV20_TEPAE|nr:SpoIIIAH-like family protein [Tepidanaerobacter acetatoxydans]AEE91546.1 Conidiation-specific protein 6 [Tepidanaerobacter acetatoxydans Re1]CCP26262.1 Conidiation-specific protein 6 [Tepidanaerobacter acetatoxydans Re1]
MAFMVRKRTVLMILFALVLVLSICMMFLGNSPKVTYNKQLNPSDLEKTSTTQANTDDVKMQSIKNLESDFFIDYKLERDRLRSQEADYLRELINNPNVSNESKEKAQQDLITLSQKIEKEMITENLIKAKGFENAVVFFSDEFINIVVKADGLLPKDVAQITDVATKTSGVTVDKITIIERK